jgi:arsenate reductase-like glutaredoxin family protein
MDVIIYHNPRCGTSRNTLGRIRNAGIEPHIIEYLKTFPTRVMLRQLAARIGVPLRASTRRSSMSSIASPSAKSSIASIVELHDLDEWVRNYNEERPHQGRWCFGKTPLQTFDAIPIARDKMIAA